MKIWDRVVEATLRKMAAICEEKHHLIQRKSTTGAVFAVSMLMELHTVAVDLERVYERVDCMRKS